jgi:flagellar biosynthesis repressor protein FlbT
MIVALKLKLKPEESVIIGGAVIKNGSKGAELFIENNVPILRQKDILSEGDVNSPCKRIYFAVQLMYIDTTNMQTYHQTYWELVKEVLAAAPSTGKIIQQISDNILTANYYQALKQARKLIEYEEELLTHAKCL